MRRWHLCWAALASSALWGSALVWSQDDKPEAPPVAVAEEADKAETKPEAAPEKPAEDTKKPETDAEKPTDADKPAATDSGKLFKELDKNGDGQLAADEVGEDRRRFFERLLRKGDKNSDGKLSVEEFFAAANDDAPGTTDDPRAERGRGRGPGGFGGERNYSEIFKRLDANGDGKLTRGELSLSPGSQQVLDKLGKDEVTEEEFASAHREFLNQMREQATRGRPGEGRPGFGGMGNLFGGLDTNGDGSLTLEEAPERVKPLVERILTQLKKEKTGSISKEEFAAALPQIAGGRPPEGPPRDGERRPEGAGPREEFRRPGPRFFGLLDQDQDGRLSKEELAKAADLVEKLDQNKDGSLDPIELLGPPQFGGFGGPGGGFMGRRPEGPPPRDGEGRGPEGRGRGDGDRRPEGPPPRDGEGRGPEGRGRGDGDRRPEGPPPRDGAGRGPEGRGRGDGDRRPEGPPPRDGAGRGPEGRDEFSKVFFQVFDANKDGKITQEEAPKRMREFFGRLDRNGDGAITPDELPAERRPEGRRRPQPGERPANAPDRDRPREEDRNDA